MRHRLRNLSTQVLCILSFRSSVFPLQCLVACAGLPRPPPSAYMSLFRGSGGGVLDFTLEEVLDAARLLEERGGPGGAAQPAGAKESSASIEAATKVGAGLSAKERRTYWQASTEGIQARQQWTPELEATVKRNEQEAADYWRSLSKKEKDRQRARTLGEHWNMAGGTGSRKST